MLYRNNPTEAGRKRCHIPLKTLVLLLLAAAATVPAMAQDFYVITANSNYLAHTDATTIGNATSFDAETCLWTISGNNIIAIAPDGTTGNTLGYTVSTNWQGNINGVNGLQFAASPAYTAWDNVTNSPSISYSNGWGTTTVYLRFRNYEWGVSDNNTHATVTKVTVSDAPNTSSSSTTSYSVTLGGDGVIYSTSGTHTYTVDINQVVTYAQTRRTFGTYGTVTVDVPSTASSAYTGAVSNVSWSVSNNTYGATITSGGVLSVSSLPTLVDNITVTFTAQVAGQTVTATQTVMLAKDKTTVDGIVGGTTGVTTTTVTLNDYEDHSWSYYNKEDNSPIRSWNPANVKISYYGAGKMYTSTGTNPSGDLSDVSSSAVRVGILSGETQNTFVYYKTLERTDGTTAANPSGRCEYRTIANPFSVRPTFTSGGTKYYTGFYRWRVKTLSGGTIHSAATGGTSYTVGSTIDAEQVIYFAPTSEYGMTVEFEAIWARAYIGGSTHVTGTNAYERNFYIGTPGGTALNYAATISAVYPDGTDGTNTNLLTAVPNTTQSNNYTCSADTKFEYIRLNAGTFNANGRSLVIGRGCTGTITQINGSTGTGNLSYSIRLESATINNLHPTNREAQTYTGTLSVRCTIGCDYDRANEDNEKVSISPTNTLIEGGGGANTFSSASNRNNLTYDWYIKSGKIQANTSINTPDPFYLGNYISSNNANQVQYMGKRRLTIEGGEMGTVAAGIGAYGNNYTNYTVNDNSWTVCIRMKGGTVNGSIYGAGVYTGASGDRRFVFTKGAIKGWVAGGCNGTRTDGGELYGESFIYVGGETHLDGTASTNVGSSNGGHVFGAGCGINGGTTVGRVNSSTIVIADQSQIARDVYGGGNYGYVRVGSGNKSDIHILGGTVNGKVFGGSNQQQGQIVNINMTGGTVIGGIHGGSNTSGTVTGPVTMQIDGGQVGAADAAGQRGNIHGGGYGQNTSVSGDISINLGSCGQTTAGVTVFGDVYGGSALGTVNTNASNTTTVSLYKGTIVGSLYGGGLGSNTVAAAVRGKVRVAVAGGSVVCASDDQEGVAGSGSVFGCNNVNGAPASDVRVDIYRTDTPTTPGSYALHAVYGGGNRAPYSGTPVVNIHGCSNSIKYVYGGGNATNVEGTDVTIWGGTIDYAFGGGNGAGAGNPGANITDRGTHLTIHGGTINHAFGGSNEKGTISDEIIVTVIAQTETGSDTCGNAYNSCPVGMNIEELYGGGNMAAITFAPTMNLDCSARVGKLFGGARMANYDGDITLNIDGGTYRQVFGGNNIDGIITGNVTVNMYGGKADTVFGGNNQGGKIYGKITVNIDSTNSTCPTRFWVGDVYGGGDEAAYAPTTPGEYPEVNIIQGTVRRNVFGGGLGAGAGVTSHPHVTVGGTAGTVGSGNVVGVFGNVYGGGNEAEVVGNTKVQLLKGLVGNANVADPETGNIFGGGKGKNSDLDAGKITGNTNVILKGGTVEHNVYGGGHLGQVTGNTNVTSE